MENARNVTIRIPHVCAAYVKIQFWFASQWIMISEINFSSGRHFFFLGSFFKPQ